MSELSTPAVNNPTFLIGAERSGTTLLRLMLSHHPDIAWLNEFEYAVDLVGDQGDWPSLEQYRVWLSTHRVFLKTGFELPQVGSYEEVVKSFMAQHVAKTACPIVGATCHRHYDRLLRLWPHARFIHMLRDPRDVARSCVQMGWAGNVWHAVEKWEDAEKKCAKLRDAVSPACWVNVRYEDLVRSPELELARLAHFLGTEYDSAMLSYPCSTSYSAPDASLINQWHHKLDPGECSMVESRVGDMMTRRGYAMSLESPSPPNRVTRIGLGVQNRCYRSRFRLKRYGLRLWAEDLVARRVPFPAWERRVNMAANAVMAKHLK